MGPVSPMFNPGGSGPTGYRQNMCQHLVGVLTPPDHLLWSCLQAGPPSISRYIGQKDVNVYPDPRGSVYTSSEWEFYFWG